MIFKLFRKISSFKRILLFKIENGKRLVLGKHFSMRKYLSIRIKKGGIVSIGENVFFNNFCSLNSVESIEIGDNCIFGEGVRIYDHNHCYKDSNMPVRKQGYRSSPVQIGENCWIGSNVIILPGVSIGNNCVIGAGVIVHKSIPDNSLVKNYQNQEIVQIERNG